MFPEFQSVVHRQKEVEPKHRGVHGKIDQAGAHRRIAKGLHGRGERDAVHDDDKSNHNPPEWIEQKATQFFAKEDSENTHERAKLRQEK